MKKVEIKCTGSDFAAIDDFHPLQGNLKTLSDENYEKLKAQILTYGFSEPIAAWDRENKKYIISGHQRIATLKRMRDEGYECPYIPYVMVEAADEHEAKMKVLSMASQYGKINPAGLRSFAEELELDIEDIDHDFSLPDVDLPALMEADSFNEGKEVDVSEHTRTVGADKINEKEIDENLSTKNECPSCGYKW